MSADATSPLTFAVGDIHGCLDKLDRLLAACEAHAGARPARYVFLGDYIDRGRFIVHGHTPLPAGIPDLRRRRVNLDTAAVMGGPLTAAVFDDTQAPPLGFLTDGGGERGSPAETIGEGSERR